MSIIRKFFKAILVLTIGVIILFILFTIMSINDTRNGVFNQDNYCFDKGDIKILQGGIEQ